MTRDPLTTLALILGGVYFASVVAFGVHAWHERRRP